MPNRNDCIAVIGVHLTGRHRKVVLSFQQNIEQNQKRQPTDRARGSPQHHTPGSTHQPRPSIHAYLLGESVQNRALFKKGPPWIEKGQDVPVFRNRSKNLKRFTPPSVSKHSMTVSVPAWFTGSCRPTRSVTKNSRTNQSKSYSSLITVLGHSLRSFSGFRPTFLSC